MTTTNPRRSADPFSAMRDVDRLFSQALRGSGPVSGAAMPMDVFRKGETFVARIDLPGVDPGTIDIDVEDNTLTVRAERTREEGEIHWLSHERPTGTFARQLQLGRGLALDKIEADYRDGVLTLTIPVAEEAKPRKITVGRPAAAESIEGTTA